MRCPGHRYPTDCWKWGTASLHSYQLSAQLRPRLPGMLKLMNYPEAEETVKKKIKKKQTPNHHQQQKKKNNKDVSHKRLSWSIYLTNPLHNTPSYTNKHPAIQPVKMVMSKYKTFSSTESVPLRAGTEPSESVPRSIPSAAAGSKATPRKPPELH